MIKFVVLLKMFRRPDKHHAFTTRLHILFRARNVSKEIEYVFIVKWSLRFRLISTWWIKALLKLIQNCSYQFRSQKLFLIFNVLYVIFTKFYSIMAFFARATTTATKQLKFFKRSENENREKIERKRKIKNNLWE